MYKHSKCIFGAVFLNFEKKQLTNFSVLTISISKRLVVHAKDQQSLVFQTKKNVEYRKSNLKTNDDDEGSERKNQRVTSASFIKCIYKDQFRPYKNRIVEFHERIHGFFGVVVSLSVIVLAVCKKKFSWCEHYLWC